MANDIMTEKAKQFLEKWKRDYAFKTLAGSLLSFGVTVLFAFYNGFLGIHLSSIWHGSICVYYLLLVTIRGMILLAEKNNRASKERAACRRRIFFISAVMLLALNLALIFPISQMVLLEKPVNMGMIPAIAMAAYTTWKLTMASVHVRKQRRNSQDNVLVAELRTINFIDALVSIITLQNTLIMVNQAKANTKDMIVLSAVSCAAIYLLILLTTVRSLIRGLLIQY